MSLKISINDIIQGETRHQCQRRNNDSTGHLTPLLLLAVPFGDKTAAIRGAIVDQNKNPISGAEVIILPGYPLTAMTDERGFFSLDPIEPGDAVVIYKELDGKGGYEYGSIVGQKTLDLYTRLGMGEQPEELVQRGFDFLFERAKVEVWEQPFALGDTVDTDGSILIVPDGASWTIEAVKEGKCHVVTRHSPDLEDPVRQFAEILIELTGKRFYYDEFY